MATGALRAPLKDRGDDCYETPREATLTLMKCEQIPRRIWEPACGPGAIVSVLRGSGRQVVATDLVDYGCEDSDSGVDFLMETRAPTGVSCIVTNPPYKLADQFVRHGLWLVPRVIMLLRLAYLEGANRSDIIDHHTARVHLGRERLPMMHRHGWEGSKLGSAAMPFAWFVFTQEPTFGVIEVRRMSWRDGQ